jgi:hypothetical protein
LLASLAAPDDSVVFRKITHPDACPACASPTPEAGAVRDAYRIRTGVIEGVTAPARLSG